MSTTKIQFNDFRHIMDIVCDFFEEEVFKVLDSRPDIFTEKHRKIFKLNTNSAVYLFTQDELLHKSFKNAEGKPASWKDKLYSKDMICKIYNDGVSDRYSAPANATLSFLFENDKLVIKRLAVSLNLDVARLYVLRNLHDIDNYFNKTIRIWARHEAGHILDYILSYEGRSEKEINKITRETEKARKAYRDWCKSNSDKNGVLPESLERKRLEIYYDIPIEARADMLGKVDRTAILDSQKDYDGVRIVGYIKSKPVKIKSNKNTDNN